MEIIARNFEVRLASGRILLPNSTVPRLFQEKEKLSTPVITNWADFVFGEVFAVTYCT